MNGAVEKYLSKNKTDEVDGACGMENMTFVRNSGRS
jgi:hypothetical protein